MIRSTKTKSSRLPPIKGRLAAGTAPLHESSTWADMPTPAIDLETKAHPRPARFASVAHSAHGAPATVALFAFLTAASSLNLEDVYGSWVLWGAVAATSAILGCLIAAAGIRPRLRLWAQLASLGLSQFIIGPVLTLNETTLAHVLPTTRTLAQGFVDTFGSFKYVISVTPPLGASGGALMALWTVNLWMGFLACSAALSAHRLSIYLSVLPIFADLAACALLGTRTGTAASLRGILITASLILWLCIKLNFFEKRRGISTGIILLTAAALAIVGPLLIPSYRFTLRDRYDPPLDPYQFTSPLSGMRSYVKYHKKDTLLTVTGLPAGTPVRLAVMDRFDGNVWNLSDSKDALDSSDYRHVGSRISDGDETGTRFRATFVVKPGLNERWLPLAGSANYVGFTHDNDSRNFYYNRSTHSAIYASGLSEEQQYTETGVLAPEPTPSQISKAQAISTSQPKTTDVPQSAGKLATALAGRQATGGKSAQKLAEGLKTNGWFSHGLTGDYPSLPGHGNYRIEAMMGDGGSMVGDSEQYASAMSMMARELGLPARVVLGFIPKDKDGEIDKSRTKGLGKDARTEFTGNDIEAWVEINLKGYGWTAFYPTPKETKTPDKNQNLTPPNPRQLVRQPPVPLTDPLYDKMQAREQSGANGDDAGTDAMNPVLARTLAIAKDVIVYGSPVWIILLICLLIVALKTVQIAVMRRRGSPARRVDAGWTAVAMMARQSGLRLHGTRGEQAKQIVDGLPIPAKDVEEVRAQADWATYSGQNVDEADARSYWRSADDLRRSILKTQHGMRRIRTRLSLKGVTGRFSTRIAPAHWLRTVWERIGYHLKRE